MSRAVWVIHAGETPWIVIAENAMGALSAAMDLGLNADANTRIVILRHDELTQQLDQVLAQVTKELS